MTRAVIPRPTLLDRAIGYVAPAAAVRRLQARAGLARYSAMVGGYQGGKRDRRATRDFRPTDGSADDAILPDLDDLRARSMDLGRNMPIARGALSTIPTNVIGAGLQLQPRIDRDYLGLSDEAADAWERDAARYYRHFTKRCHFNGTLSMGAMQHMLLHSVLDAGDVFVLLADKQRQGDLFGLKLQVVEALRVTNPNLNADRWDLSGGIERDADGLPIAAHVCNRDPHFGSTLNAPAREWQRVPFYGDRTGRRVVLHLFEQLRDGQSRGVPILAPVIEYLKQLSNLTDAELMATVVNSCFAMVVKSEDGSGTPLEGSSAANALKRMDLSFEPGMVIEGLAPNESIESFTPGRPMAGFDGFFSAIVQQIAIALDLSFEVLMRHFTASYSASRAALLETWKFLKKRRQWFAEVLCQPVYEAVISEAVERGYLAARGWDDPLTREAWLGADWIGPSAGQLDPTKEVEAAERRIALGASTYSAETAELTGGDWERNYGQLVKETRMRRAAGFDAEPMAERIQTEAIQPPAPQPNPDRPEDETQGT
ncbi:MAG: phage portal protein [Inquilinus sp.]|uniref:phage portal protein n=1 Tax=Inquilinus sp. TaxID=1932117 RepID=UPI003F2F1C17